jgi:hypothetical protein
VVTRRKLPSNPAGPFGGPVPEQKIRRSLAGRITPPL